MKCILSLHDKTIFLAMNYLDHYMYIHQPNLNLYPIIAKTILFIAIKMEELEPYPMTMVFQRLNDKFPDNHYQNTEKKKQKNENDDDDNNKEEEDQERRRRIF